MAFAVACGISLRGADSKIPLEESRQFANDAVTATTLDGLGLNMDNYVAPQVAEKLSPVCETDPALGEKAVRRIVQLYITAQQQGAFRNNYEESNGNNFASLLIDDIGKSTPGFGTLRVAWRLYHHDLSGQFAHSGWEQLHGWDRAMQKAFEKGGGWKDRAAGLRAALEPLRGIMGDDPPGLMFMGLCGFASKLDGWEQVVVAPVVDDLARNGGELAPLAKLLALALKVERSKMMHPLPGRPDAKWLEENHAWLAQLRDLAADPRIPAQNRFALAAHLVRTLAPLRDAETIRRGIEDGSETLEWDQPTNGFAWEPLLIAFNQLPADDKWRATAERFSRAWTQRCRLESEPHGTPRRFAPGHISVYHAMDTMARAGRMDDFKKCAELLHLNSPQYFVLMVRRGLHEAAAEWLRTSKNQRSTVKLGGFGFRKDDVAATDKFCATLKDPALELLARIHIANNPSSDDGAPRSGTSNAPRWDMRLAALVPVFRGTKFADYHLQRLCLDLLCDGPLTGLLLNDEVVKATTNSPVLLRSQNSYNAIQERLRVHTALVCNGAGAGNLAPLKDVMQSIRGSAQSSSDWHYLTGATFVIGELNEGALLLAPECDATGIRRWRDANDLALEMFEGDQSANYEMISQALRTQAILHALANSADDLAKWRKNLSKSKTEGLKLALKSYGSGWDATIAAFCRKGVDGLRSPEERLRIVTAMMADPWMKTVTSNQQTLLQSLVRRGTVSSGELLGAADAMIAADAEGGKRHRELAAIAWDAGRKDLAKLFLDAAAKTSKKDMQERFKLGGAEAN